MLGRAGGGDFRPSRAAGPLSMNFTVARPAAGCPKT